MTVTPFGTLSDGRRVEAFTIQNTQGMEMCAISYGCAIVSLLVPDRRGERADVVLGCDTLDGYVAGRAHLGAVCGRYANRIAHGRFVLDGRTHELPRNSGGHHLHGGPRGFHRVVWEGEPFRGPSGAGVAFTHVSPDGDEGYPGRLEVRVTYTLTDRGELAIEYRATTDRPTVVNLTQHSYFNLAGHDHGGVLGHELQVHAARYTPVEDMIPTGVLAPVEGTPLDFRRPTPIGARITDARLCSARGYDHNFALDRWTGALEPAARLIEPRSGRALEVLTTEPGLQLYTGNSLDGQIRGKGAWPYASRGGVCLETQRFPDSPNQPGFPPAVLRPGEVYESRTTYAFSAL
jgi:aldose 1-epimerase